MKVIGCHYPTVVIYPDYVVLDEPFDVTYLKDGRVSSVCIPEGVRSDFASIPWYVRWLISRTDREILIASIIHDYQVGQFSGEPVEKWRDAAQFLKEVMEFFADPKGVSWWSRLKRHLVYRGVMLNGILKRKASI